ncbi:MAG: polyribonucleotide nucleotidyltransferase, partial [Candidatus Krumholzibacteria bacterium]|nr:polyribonucleotide nucleotidyltransferase [Candidatus Krumholzibacteria bacterium]
ACSVLSSDQQLPSDILGITGASLALALSDIPFGAILSGVRVGMKDGKFIANPTFVELDEGQLDIVVAGSDDAILMVEGGAKEISEAVLLEALEFAHAQIKQINAFQREFLAACAPKAKRSFVKMEINKELETKLRADYLAEIDRLARLEGKLCRQNALSDLRTAAVAKYGEAYPDSEKQFKKVMEQMEREVVRSMIVGQKIRCDGRGYTDIRNITCEVGVLPRTHGSALFTRGETQSLVVTTLGTAQDEQRMDELSGESFKSYMLHYNFPPFSVGEVGRFSGPGRREIGHGMLAERAIEPVIPADENFPYTIRVVSDVLESNGSSSMATVCGGSLALMDAGVPIKKPVAGVAMGLVKEGDRFAILTDILGLEDHDGDMDFKVAGTRDGITAFQMDVKIAGIPRSIMEPALEQAREARMKVLDIMNRTMTEARKEISPYAPKIVQIKIPVDKIRDVIGPGGKMIRHIQDTSGAKIQVEDDGTIEIAAIDQAAGDKALEMIRGLTEEPEVGKVYKGTVRGIQVFGAFVQILPGRDGLLHISEIDRKRVERVEDVLKLGDEIEVKVIGIDKDGKVKLSRKVLL